jgi:dihydropteroate synthase
MTPDDFEHWLQQPRQRRRPLVMGVLNVTPDSFSDGGRFADPAAAADQALRMVSEGADLIDVGGESTRPGSQPVPEAEQVRRVVPVLRAVRAGSNIVCSIDTTRAAVAEAALDAGAAVVNDISAGLDDPLLLPLAACREAPLVLMHMQGTPATMQVQPRYANVMAEVREFLLSRAEAAKTAGIAPYRILLDPGIGFGKAQEHNLALLRELSGLTGSVGERPVLVGVSRKGFIGRITGVAEPAECRFGTAAAVAWSIANGAAMVRVHDVGPMSQVVRMIGAILGDGEPRV